MAEGNVYVDNQKSRLPLCDHGIGTQTLHPTVMFILILPRTHASLNRLADLA